MGDKLDLTPQELERIKESFKNQEFRKLFFDYVQEISDPQNRELYEREIAQLEAEKGIDVRYIKPEPSYVLKTFTLPAAASTSTSTSTSTTTADPAKVFVNICSSKEVEPATLSKQKPPHNASGKTGQNWSVPYSLGTPRDDVDNAKKPCQVYDCVFHPDTLRMGSTNLAFSNMLAMTAFEGIEAQFKVALDKANFIRLGKMKAKGTPATTMIRTKMDKPAKEAKEETSLQYIERIQKEQQHQQQQQKQSSSSGRSTQPAPAKSSLITEIAKDPKSSATGAKAATDGPRTPQFSIVYQDLRVDFQRYTSERERDNGARPDALKISISLPGVRSAGEAELDVGALTLDLKVSTTYLLHIDLPFPVFPDKGTAKFDKSKSELVITVPVVPAPPAPKSVDSISVAKAAEAGMDDTATTDADGIEDDTARAAADASPLITVLETPAEVAEARRDAAAQPQPQDRTNLDDQCLSDLVNEQLNIADADHEWHVPPFHTSQGTSHVTIIVDVANIDAASIKTSLSPLQANISFKDADSKYWRLTLGFESPVSSQASSAFNTSSRNGVLVLEKAAKGFWNKMTVVAADDTETAHAMLDSVASVLKSKKSDDDADKEEKVADVEAVSVRRRGDEVVVSVTQAAPTDAPEAAETAKTPASIPAKQQEQPAAAPSEADAPTAAPVVAPKPAPPPVTLSSKLLYTLD
ncbi:pre-RNA processing PIH1/Nop17-domain-containing protein [Entophlyctis helioformis]|nr:pre-RNA processing PIH1/Nop17-domain-containing protein [Entophlyctis helioformis]